MRNVTIKRISNEIISMEFPTKDALDDYLREHPLAKRENHHVVENKQTVAPSKPTDPSKPTVKTDINSLFDPKINSDERVENYSKTLVKGLKENDLFTLDENGKPQGSEDANGFIEDMVLESREDAKSFFNHVRENIDFFKDNPEDLVMAGVSALRSPTLKSLWGKNGAKQVANIFFEEALGVLQEGPAWDKNPSDPQPPSFDIPKAMKIEGLYDKSVPSKTRVTNYTKELLKSAKDSDILEYGEDGKPIGHEDADMYFSDILSNAKGDPKKFTEYVENSISDIGDNDYAGLVRMGISALQSPEIKKQFGADGCKQAANAYIGYALNGLQTGPAWQRNPDDPQPPQFDPPARG